MVMMFLAYLTAHGATFTPDVGADTVDAAPGDGVCADSAGGCSLRAAVMEANSLAGYDTIVLAAETYTLALVVGAGAEGGDLDVTDPLRVVGAGSSSTVLSGRSLSRVFRVEGVQLTLQALSLTDGLVPAGEDGGLLHSDGPLVLRDVSVAAGTADHGGCVFAGATLVAQGVEAIGCVARNYGGGFYTVGAANIRDGSFDSLDGNAVYAEGPLVGSWLTITDIRRPASGGIDGQFGIFGLGGIDISHAYFEGNDGAVCTRGGDAFLDDVTVEGTWRSGAMFYSGTGHAEVRNSRFIDNIGTVLKLEGTSGTVVDTVFASNRSSANTVEIKTSGTLERCTFSGNAEDTYSVYVDAAATATIRESRFVNDNVAINVHGVADIIDVQIQSAFGPGISVYTGGNALLERVQVSYTDFIEAIDVDLDAVATLIDTVLDSNVARPYWYDSYGYSEFRCYARAAALSVSGTASMTGGAIIRNSGSCGPTVYVAGELTMLGVRVEDNSSDTEIINVLDRPGSVVLRDTMLRNNQSACGLSTSGSSARTVHMDGTLWTEHVGTPVCVADGAVLSMVNSTLYSNNAVGPTLSVDGVLDLQNVTVANNSSATGVAALYVQPGSSVTVRNTIVADNTTAAGDAADCDGSLFSAGGNLVGAADTCVGLVGTDLVGTVATPLSPRVGPLIFGLGPTPVVIPHPLGPAIDGGLNAECASTDVMDTARPTDGDGDGTSTCDIGAVELVP
jgi:hypothetical protein